MNADKTLADILEKSTALLEAQNEIIQTHRQAFEDIYRQLAGLTEKVKILERGNHVNSDNIEFLSGITARLKVIGTTIEGKKDLADRS